MKLILEGTDSFVRACINSNDIFLQMESSGFITHYWKPFTPIKGRNDLNGMVRKTEKGTIVMRN